MYLKICCAIFLLALVACQAAPSSNVIENSINEAGTTFDNIELEDTSAEKDRAKKSATTFCVEIRSGKKEQVPCRLESQRIIQEVSKPVIVVQPVPVPAPLPPVEFPKQPIVIKQQKPQPLLQPVPAAAPIINIVPPAPAPCDKPTIVQPTQPQIHTVHVIHPRPAIQEIRPIRVENPIFRPPQALPVPQQTIALLQKPICKKCKGVIIPSVPGIAQSAPYIDTYTQGICRRTGEEAYRCSCEPENRFVDLSPYRFNIQGNPRMSHSDGVVPNSMDTATFNSIPRSSMMSAEHDPSVMSDQSMFFAPGAREMEERRFKLQYIPLEFDDTRNYSPLPNRFQYDPVQAYTTSPSENFYPIVIYYPNKAIKPKILYVPETLVLGSGGLFEGPREFRQMNSLSQPNNEARAKPLLSDIIQWNNEPKEVVSTEKESINEETIPKTNVDASTK